MKKLIILTLALTMIMASAALASKTRSLTMGDNHVILTSDDNIWNWSSRLFDYPDLAVAEFGYDGGLSGDNLVQLGIHWKFNEAKPWVLATYFDNAANFSLPFGNPISTPSQNNRINLLYARMMGANKFGTRISIYNSSEKSADTSGTFYNQSLSWYELSLSLTSEDNSWDVAATFGKGTWKDELDADTVYSEPDGVMSFDVLGRMFWHKGTTYTYVPHAQISYVKQGEAWWYGTGAEVENYKYSVMMVEVGIGQTYAPSEAVEAVIDAGLSLSNYKETYDSLALGATDSDYENKVNNTVIPYFKVGLDGEVFNWMDVRLGATSTWLRHKEEFTQGAALDEFWQNRADNATYLGFGFHWGNLQVDTWTDPQLFFNGFDFVAGNGSGGMNMGFSAVYGLK